MDKLMVKPAKKLLPMLILDILRRKTDASHHLTQKQIGDLLLAEYDMSADRKSIRRNIDNLVDMGYDIEFSKCTNREVKDAKTGEIETTSAMSGVWLAKDFEDSELRLIIDSLLFSSHVPQSQLGDLIDKLVGLSSEYFEAHVKHIHSVPSTLPASAQLFWTIDQLDAAISAKRKVSFNYLDYGIDKKQHPRRRPDGTVREYVVSPYQMAAKDGKYYLICNYDKYDDVSNYRVDRIANVQILDEPLKPFSALQGSQGAPLDLAKYVQEHVYMYSSATSRVRFRVVKRMAGDVINEFGLGVRFEDETDDYVTVSARVNERAAQQFAKNFAPDVLILEPKRLAEKVREEAAQTVAAYEEIEKEG